MILLRVYSSWSLWKNRFSFFYIFRIYMYMYVYVMLYVYVRIFNDVLLKKTLSGFFSKQRFFVLAPRFLQNQWTDPSEILTTYSTHKNSQSKLQSC